MLRWGTPADQRADCGARAGSSGQHELALVSDGLRRGDAARSELQRWRFDVRLWRKVDVRVWRPGLLLHATQRVLLRPAPAPARDRTDGSGPGLWADAESGTSGHVPVQSNRDW